MDTEAPNVYLLHPVEGVSGKNLFLQELHRTEDVLGGGLNLNWIYVLPESEQGERFVLRLPRSAEERDETVRIIIQEYEGVGATQEGIQFRLRTIREQAKFIDALLEHGRKSVQYLDAQDNMMLLPYVHGISLHHFLPLIDSEEKFEVVRGILRHLHESHAMGITYGDRWCTNTMVFTDGDFVELDFDVELIGEPRTIQSFEIAQTLYHLIHFAGISRQFVTNHLIHFFLNEPEQLSQYDTVRMIAFLLGHARYFKTVNPYEGLVPPYDEVLALADGIMYGEERRQSNEISLKQPVKANTT